ncbi:hypothetical protein K1T71_006447 [Dendrolimus kikuchii]|uniref:Uncharacterized protein n=1 Tax=Dendrolimus kikuchii TaxID=765133 RepID=A0ACC1D0V1_9NEOP|nr:hypothetical protein K1T71_006447 [Dendrolimus kikuchii]
MRARTVHAVAAIATLAALARVAYAQDALYVDVKNQSDTPRRVDLQHQERYTSDLSQDLEKAREDILDLYTEFTSKAGVDLRNFLSNISFYADDAVRSINNSIQYDDAPDDCRKAFNAKLRKIAIDAQRAATFSGDNHHKYLRGHMVVFRIHLNKSEEYIKKSDRILRGCGTSCEIAPRVRRWRRLAAEELHRVRDDLQHSRKSYHDIVNHARRKLTHFRKQITVKAKDAVEKYHECLQRGY